MIIPAYNEQDGIRVVVEEVVQAVEPLFADYEIILVNDGSTDNTRKIMEELARGNEHVRIIDNERNRGLGAALGQGYSAARFEYAGWSSGDATDRAIFTTVFSKAGEADVIIGYPVTSKGRPLGRRIVSRGFTLTMNLLFGLRVPYYNGCCLLPTRQLQAIPFVTESFAFHAEALVRLLKKGLTFITVPYHNVERTGGRSKAVKWKNIKGVLKTIWRLLRADLRSPAPVRE